MFSVVGVVAQISIGTILYIFIIRNAIHFKLSRDVYLTQVLKSHYNVYIVFLENNYFLRRDLGLYGGKPCLYRMLDFFYTSRERSTREDSQPNKIR